MTDMVCVVTMTRTTATSKRTTVESVFSNPDSARLYQGKRQIDEIWNADELVGV